MPPPPPSIQFLKNLTSSDIDLLTQLLRSDHNPPHHPPKWHLDQTSFILSLPPILLRPTGLLPRLATHLLFTPQRAVLCPTHKPLNPYLIRRIFLQVTNECTTRVARLETHPLLPPHLLSFVKRMHAINSLWMSPALYRTAFQVFPHEPRFERLENECEACILSFIGGHAEILSDLRTSMLGRKKKGKPVPRLLRLVEAWIGWVAERSEDIFEESDILARDVREIRRQLQLARRQKRRNEKEGIHDGAIPDRKEEEDEGRENRQCSNKAVRRSDTIAEHEEETEHDFENSIINEYAERFSKTPALFQLQEGDIHPAYRDSLAFDPESGTFFHLGGDQAQRPQPPLSLPPDWTTIQQALTPQALRPQRPERPLPPSVSSESVYHSTHSQPSGPRRPQRPPPPPLSAYSASVYPIDQLSIGFAGWTDGLGANELAEEYQALIPRGNN